MKKLLSILATLSLLSPLAYFVSSTPAYALADCQIRFLDKNNSDKDVGTFYPNTAFKVLIWNIPLADQNNTYFNINGVDSKGGVFIPLDASGHPRVAGADGADNGSLIVIFPDGSRGGYINDGVNGVSQTGLAPGTYTVYAYQLTNGSQISSGMICGSRQFTVVDYAAPGTCSASLADIGGTVQSGNYQVDQNFCAAGYTPKTGPNSNGQNCQCSNGSSSTANNAANPSGNGTSTVASCIQTDLGCIPTDPRGLANAILNVIFGIAGAVATILIIIGGFKVAGSQGNVEALEDGRDMITKAITGLVFILLASVILSIIGLDILGLNFAFGPTGVFPINR